MWFTATALNPFELSPDAGATLAAAVATTERLLISWRRLIFPRSKSSSSLAIMFSIVILH
jgi:hypothetical protein